MTASIRLQIRDAALALLNSTDRPGDVPAFTARRMNPPESDVDITAAVFFLDEPVTTPQGPRGAIVKRHLQLCFQLVGSAHTAATLDDDFDPALQWIVQCIGNTQFDGLVLSCEEVETKWEPVKMDRVYLVATVRFDVEYQTRRNDVSIKQ